VYMPVFVCCLETEELLPGARQASQHVVEDVETLLPRALVRQPRLLQ